MNRVQHSLILQKNIVTSLPDLVSMVSRVLMMWICSVKMLDGVLSLGQVAMLMIFVGASFGPVSSLSSVSGSLIQTFAAAERIFDIYDEEPEVSSPQDPVTITKTSGELDLDKVIFSYPGTDTAIISGLSIHIDPGMKVALWGESGCGKSTVLRLIMRFWDPDSGRISLDNVPLPEMKLEELRAHVSMLAQDTWMSAESIADNIRMGVPSASMEEIRNAARMACIDERIMALPDGYCTPAGELGERLSGGERQRIGIARVLLRNSPVLLLDEPTSSLDTINEKGILKTINETMCGKTVITVSHRWSTIAGADRILHFDKGNVTDVTERG